MSHSPPAPTTDPTQPPPLRRDHEGRVEPGALADVIEWFLNHDPRVNLVRHPRVEQIFQWKQQEAKAEGETVFEFENAETRLDVGVMQALVEYADEPALHGWITQLLGALDNAAKTNEEVALAYRLDTAPEASPLEEAHKLPTRQGRTVYLTCCWLEALCTAEARVLGWIYQQLYDQPYAP